jgi:hypothetical protein
MLLHVHVFIFDSSNMQSRVDGWGTMLQARRPRVQVPMRSLIFSVYLILPATPWPGVYSASNRNGYQKIFLGLKRGWRIRITASPPFVNRLSRKYRILDISQPYRTPWPVTEIALLFAFTFLACKDIKIVWILIYVHSVTSCKCQEWNTYLWCIHEEGLWISHYPSL